MMSYKVLITGASRGIGRAIALQLAKNGQYRLLLHASSASSLKELIGLLPVETEYEILPFNFANEEEVSQLIRHLKQTHKDLYAIVSNAGITRDKGLAFQPLKEIDELIQVNLKVPIQLAKAAMKIFPKNDRGVFIALSSCVAETGSAFQSVYTATKAANVSLCKSLAREAGVLHTDKLIRFISVAPGFIQTDMTNKLSEEIQQKYLRQIPSGRFGKTEEVAHAIEFLLSENASYINGSEFKINGGLL
ncbi:MAG: SDR family oxidoreductase [Bacteroidetes bacterium]|nr:SDR family oxidoreductase [Bacteroidota bacterium]